MTKAIYCAQRNQRRVASYDLHQKKRDSILINKAKVEIFSEGVNEEMPQLQVKANSLRKSTSFKGASHQKSNFKDEIFEGSEDI